MIVVLAVVNLAARQMIGCFLGLYFFLWFLLWIFGEAGIFGFLDFWGILWDLKFLDWFDFCGYLAKSPLFSLQTR